MATMIVIVGYVLFDMNAVAKGSELDEDIMMVEPKNNDFDISKLKEINSDIVGWITINNTDINYPILQADDNGHYLSRNYRNEFATAGSIFLDYRDNFIDDVFLIIYGHRMSYGKMFSDVTKYSEKDYFDEHLDGELYIGNDKKKLEVIGFAKISAVINNNIIKLPTIKEDNTKKTSFFVCLLFITIRTPFNIGQI